MLLFPANTDGKTTKGTHQWDGSAAQKQLKHDIDNGKHLTMTNKELRLTSEDYKRWTLPVFSDHVKQELNRRKFLANFKARKGRN